MKKIPLIVILFIILLLMHSTIINAKGFKYIEIFDAKQDEVVKVVQLNKEIHNMVVGWINNTDSIYAKNDPVPSDGYAIRIPLEPAVKVHGNALNALVNEVYIIIPENDPPFFMVFEGVNKLTCFPFEKGNVNILLKSLDFKSKIKNYNWFAFKNTEYPCFLVIP